MWAALVSASLASSHDATRVEIAPGVLMPYMNLGGVKSSPSNYSLWLQLGGRGLDTALTYGDDIQREVGQAVAASGLLRSEIFVISKVPCCPNKKFCADNRTNATADVETDLRLLGLDYADLILLHWTCDSVADAVNAYRALEDFAISGKARAIGISNFNASAIAALYDAKLRVPPAVNQCGFSVGDHNWPPLGSDLETLATCRERGITYSAYSPLGGLSPADPLHNKEVLSIAASHGKSAAQARAPARPAPSRSCQGVAHGSSVLHSLLHISIVMRRWRCAGWCSRASRP